MKFGLALLVAFLAVSSVATGAVQWGPTDGRGWRLSAHDVQGRPRLALVSSASARFRLLLLSPEGQCWWSLPEERGTLEDLK